MATDGAGALSGVMFGIVYIWYKPLWAYIMHKLPPRAQANLLVKAEERRLERSREKPKKRVGAPIGRVGSPIGRPRPKPRILPN